MERMTLPQHALRTPDANSRDRDASLAPARLVQRKCGCGGTCGSCSDDEKKKKVQRRALGDTSPEMPKSVESILGSPGRALDTDTRATMESRFGRSFADVRVHTDSHAAASAREIDAAAYTSGTHIVFGDGRFAPQTTSGGRLLAHELAHVVQQRSGTALPTGIGPADDIHERAADRVADAVVAMGPTFAPPPVIVPVAERLVRRKREEDAPAAATTEPAKFIVEDNEAPAVGQMRRSAFVEELDAAICATSSQEMGRLGRSTEGCPLLEQWRPRIRAMGARQLEVSLRRWAGAENEVRSARDYIPLVSKRLAESLRVWGATGQIVGVPPDLMQLLGGGKIKVGVGSLLRGAVGSLFRKARDGAAAPVHAAPVALAEGRALDGGVASRMGNAFGRDFSDVRIHTDSEAAVAATRMNARAFTIGNDIAFAGGEYAPGTIVGDALLAHELAHVAQQDGAEGPLAKSDDAHGALEHDADDAAVHAVVSLWPNVRRFARGIRTSAMPRLKSSLKLQRCSLPEITPDSKERGGLKPGPGCTPAMLAEIEALHPEAIGRVRNAYTVLGGKDVADFDDQLKSNFGVTSKDTAQVAEIRENFGKLLAMMTGKGLVEIACADVTDSACQEKPGKTAETSGCFDYKREVGEKTALPQIKLCGDLAMRSKKFLYTDMKIREVPYTRKPEDWVKTIIHEYTHTLCRTFERFKGEPEIAPIMHRPGVETYKGQKEYPSSQPTNNPDSYAAFAMESSKVKT